MLFGNGLPEVLSGPFKGTKYLHEVFWGAVTSRWLGTCEMELHPAIRDVIRTPYQQIFDIGCAEGYYVVGLALQCPNVTIYARDGNPWSRDQCRRLAKLNGVSERVKVGGIITPADLQSLMKGKSFVLCDIEGFELGLLEPVKCPKLADCDIIVETHDSEGSTLIIDTLVERFSPTHQVTQICTMQRPPDLVKGFFSPDTPDELIEKALSEGRPANQKWLLLKSKQGIPKT